MSSRNWSEREDGLCLEELEGTGKLISEPEYHAWQLSTGVQSMYEVYAPVWSRALGYDKMARSTVDMM